MQRKCQVVMLPTDKSNLAIIKETNKLVIADNNHHFAKGDRSEDYLTPQHLYFTTDDEIKKDNWYITPSGNVVKALGPCSFGPEWRKIVTTTNKELWHWKTKCKACNASGFNPAPHHCKECNGSGVHNKILIPKIPTDFIEAYVREQGRIKEVLLEYEDTFNDFANEGFKGIELPKIWKPKLRPNGTVIIHPVKPVTYSAEEFRKAVQMAFNDGANWAYNTKIYTSLTSGDPIPSEDYFNKHYNNQ